MSGSENSKKSSTFVKFGEGSLYNKDQIESIKCDSEKCVIKMKNNPTVDYVDDKAAMKDIHKFMEKETKK